MMTGFERYTKKTRRAMFLEEMEQVVPWAKLCALIEPHYPSQATGDGRKNWNRCCGFIFCSSGSTWRTRRWKRRCTTRRSLRQFVGIDLGAEPVPDETTVCKFRHLLEEHHLGEEILGTVNLHLQAKGVRITTGTIVDATLIHAPSSTKNRDAEPRPRDAPDEEGEDSGTSG